MLSYEAIDPTLRPDFDAIVNRIVKDAAAERDVIASTSKWFVPALLAASIASAFLMRPTESPELSEALGIPHQVVQWSRQDHPANPTAVDVLQSFGRTL